MRPGVFLDAVETREINTGSNWNLRYISSPKYHYFAQVSIKINCIEVTIWPSLIYYFLHFSLSFSFID